MLAALGAAETVLVPKLLFRIDLFHLKDDLGARVAFLLKFRTLALRGKLKDFAINLARELTEFSQQFPRQFKMIAGTKWRKNSCTKAKEVCTTKLYSNSTCVKQFGFNIHRPTMSVRVHLYLHSLRLFRSVNFAYFSFAMHRIY